MSTSRKVLLIDDDDIVNSINSVIIKHAKFADEVKSVNSVPQALEILKKKSDAPDVIFLDLNMPDYNGWDFIDECKRIGLDKDIKIIMLTSSISLKDEERAAATDMITAFISKPLSPELLESISTNHLPKD